MTKRNNSKRVLLVLLLLFWPAGLIYWLVKRADIKAAEEKNWFLKHPVATFFIVYFTIGFFVNIFGVEVETETSQTDKEVDEEILYMSVGEIESRFSGLTELQAEEKFRQLKNKTIRTTIRVDRVDQATLSSQYVVLQMKDSTHCTAKAFFPAEEKDRLLQANSGDRITFVGTLVNYKEGLTSCIEFTKSRVIDIEPKTEESGESMYELCKKLEKSCQDYGAGCDKYMMYCI